MNITPLKAIRLKCLDCSAGSADEVKKCPIDWCPLYYYRSGHNPNRKGIGNKTPDFSRKMAESVSEFDAESE